MKAITVKRAREWANAERRRRTAAKQAPLPIEEQLLRFAENREAHQRRYPSAPVLDPMSQARGDPRLRGEPGKPRPAPRKLRLADMVYAFGYDVMFPRWRPRLVRPAAPQQRAA